MNFWKIFGLFLKKSVDFVLSGQTLEGDVLWAKDKNDKWMDDSLVTGCSSIYKSLRDFEQISKILGKKYFYCKRIRSTSKGT